MLLLAALLLAQAQEPPPWAQFSVRPQRGAAVYVRIGPIQRRRRGDPVEYWFERMIVPQYHPEMLSSTDTRACPAARAVLAEMAEVPAPRFRPDPSAHLPPILDTVYRLEAPAAYPEAWGTSRQEIAGGSRSPVARWIDRMQSALESCWRAGRREAVTSH